MNQKHTTMSTYRYNRPYSLHFRCPGGGCPSTALCTPDLFQKSCAYSEPRFTNTVQRNLVTLDQECYSKTIDISKIRTFSFLVINNGPNPVVAQPELSPDQEVWDSFGELPYTVPSRGKHLFVLQFFLRYARIKYRNEKPGQNSLITVWFQGQS